MLPEAVRLVADLLEQAQGHVVPRQPQRRGPRLHIDDLLALRQRYDHRRLDRVAALGFDRAIHLLEAFERGVKLPEPAVDQDHIREQLGRTGRVPVAPHDDLADHRVIVHALHRLDTKAPIAAFERPPVDETDQRAD